MGRSSEPIARCDHRERPAPDEEPREICFWLQSDRGVRELGETVAAALGTTRFECDAENVWEWGSARSEDGLYRCHPPLGALRARQSPRTDRVRIGDVLLRRGDSMLYAYDFGDDWRHTIEFEEVVPTAPVEALPRCTDGRGEAAPEDSGPAGRARRAARRIDVAEVNAALDWLGGRKR